MDDNIPKPSSILGLGNPLLDVIASCDGEFLKKYDLLPNNAILASEKHANLCQDIIDNFPVQYLAGGAVQNTMRVAQWFYSKPKICTYFGCIGLDDYGRQMKEKAQEDQVNAIYLIDPKVPTGTCACLITNNGKCRSLCAYLGASQNYSINHIHENIDLVEKAQIFYVSGFHMIVSLEATLFLAKHSHSAADKSFVLNLSAPYISEFYSESLLQILPYVDLLFGNETEAEAFSKLQDWKTADLEVIAQKIADWKHFRPRIVVLTHGKNNIVVAYSNSPDRMQSFPVPQMSDDEIVDTNGAGDSFVGGFLAYRLMNRSMPECIEAGTYAAQEIIKQSGCVFPKLNSMKLI
ncbi:adenosine kinase [Sarcoptes scabiei]|nr:adenosine kinase [Sarcoptes scabiei]